jgi:hypothetical protein
MVNNWIKTSDELPVIPDDAPEYSKCVRLLAAFGDIVIPVRYARNMYAKTERGRAARWERWDRSLSSTPDYWMEMPKAPAESASTENGQRGSGE